MTSVILQAVFIACSMVLLASARKMDTEREALIEAAIQEVKMEVSHVQTTKLSKAQQMLKAFKMASPKSKAQGMAAYKFERMVNLAERKILKSRRQATAQSSSMAEALAMELLHRPGSILTGEEIARMYEESECAEVIESPPDCDSPAVQNHRTADGTCNNLENPTYGAAGTRMRRLISAIYDDGISVGRGFLQSQELPPFTNGVFNPPNPSPRIASIEVVGDRQVNDSVHTHILMQWGQFMDHDLDIVPEFESCPEGCEVLPENVGRCYPIRVAEDDENVLVTRTDSESAGCLGFRRSLPACPGEDDDFEAREQLNAISHFIDGSMVYHHDPDVQSTRIRDPDSDMGLLRVGDPDPGADSEEVSRYLLPNAEDGEVLCLFGVPADCFLAGDVRVNEQAGLSVMHTIWVREHNRIAEILHSNNPSFSSDRVFETAREIVISEIQKITYKDFLPILVGDALIEPYTEYDSSVDPSIPNAFAAAAYRYGHSQIQPFFERLDTNYQSIAAGPLSLNDAFFNTGPIRNEGVDPLLRGLLEKPARKVDEFLNSVLTNNLFASDDSSPGLDLASLNIQRGRDHGLPPYSIWKQWAKRVCNVESDFRNELTEIHLYQVYGSLDTVDLFVGGLAEQPLDGSLVGAVFACIFANTFKALRDGDRFYYENPVGFLTAEQRAEIERASLSRVICDNSGISEIQANAFLADIRVNCDTLPTVDLSVWDETPLTGECFTRVGSDANTQVIVLSQNIQSSQNEDEETISANSAGCFKTLCPTDASSTSLLYIFAQPGFSFTQDSDLPPSSPSGLSYLYSNNMVNSNVFVPSNGFYASQADCMSGDTEAISFFSDTAASKQSTGRMGTYPARIAEIADMIHDKRVLAEYLRSTSSSEQNREEMLQEEVLQAMHREEAMKEEDEDTLLVSDLEKLLEKMK